MRRLCPFLLLFLLTGCVTATTTTPPVIAPKAFSDSGEKRLQEKWWQQFNTPELNRVIEQALCGNFSISTAKERIKELEAATSQARATLLPKAEFDANYSGKKQNGNSTNEIFSLGLAADFELDLWGRLRAKRRAALADFLASKELFKTAVLTISAETAITWLSWIENNQQLRLIQEQQQLNRKNEKIIEWKVLSGLTGIADLLQQRQLIETSEVSLAECKAKGSLLAHRLNILLGKTPQIQPLFSAEIKLPELPPLPATGIPLDLLQYRPDVKASWLAFKAADQRAAAAIADRFPRFSIRAGYETNSVDIGELFNNWLTTFAANLFTPIFDGGFRRAEIKRRQAVAKQKYYLWGEKILLALKEVEDTLTQEKTLKKQMQSYRNQLELAKNSIEAIGNRYRQGEGNYQRVLQATLSRQNLERAILSNQLQLLTNRVSLYRALSGKLPEEEFQKMTSNDNG